MTKVDNFYKHYHPSVPAAIVSAIIFAVLTTAHLVLLLKSNPKRKFTIAFIIGGCCEFLAGSLEGTGLADILSS